MHVPCFSPHLSLRLPFALCPCLFARPTCAPWPQTPTVSTALSGRLTGISSDKAHTCDMLRERRGGASWRAAWWRLRRGSRSTTAHAALQASPLHGHTVLSPATRLPTAHPSDKTGYTYDPTNTTEGAGRPRARHAHGCRASETLLQRLPAHAPSITLCPICLRCSACSLAHCAHSHIPPCFHYFGFI